MNKACEICGGVGTGFDELIMICSQCKETREHVYCTRSFYDGDLEKWWCDECQSPTQIPLSSHVLSKPVEGFKISGTIKRLPMKSKVQFLPPEEAICLESGAPKMKFSPSKTPKKDFTTLKKRLPPNFYVKPNPQVVPQAIRKPLKPGNIPRSSSDEKWLAAVKKKPITHTRPAWKESSVDMGLSIKSAQTYNGTEKKVAVEGSAKTRPSGELLNSNGERKNNGARRSIRDLYGASSGECPSKRVFKETTAKPLPYEEILNTSTEKENPCSKQVVQGLKAVSSGCSAKHVFQGTTPKSLPSEEILKMSTEKDNSCSTKLLQGLKAANSERGSQCQSSNSLTPLPFSELQELIMEKCGDDVGANAQQKSTDAELMEGDLSATHRGDVCANTQQKRADVELMESLEVALKFEKFLPNHPAESPTWRGNFNVTSNTFYGFYDGILAHPPSKVHRKVYELSKQLPELLQFELLPRLSLWVDLFDEDIPGPCDIGLYFLPTKSCEELYFFLVKRLNDCDMLLKSYSNGVELLIFSSKNLQDGCEKIDKRCFLWGVFRSCEDIVMGEKEKSPGIPGPIDDQVCGMEEDMEIDMIGGHEMDNVDKVVSKAAQSVLDATPKFSPVKVKEEPLPSPGCDISNGNVARDLSSYIELCFDRELQKGFDRFDAYVKGKDKKTVKMEKD